MTLSANETSGKFDNFYVKCMIFMLIKKNFSNDFCRWFEKNAPTTEVDRAPPETSPPATGKWAKGGGDEGRGA